RVILEAFITRSADADTSRREQLAQARRAFTEAQGRICRLLELVEHGFMDVNDPTLKERLKAAKLARQTTAARVHLLDAAGAAGPATIIRERLTRLAASLHQTLQNGDPGFRKAYLRIVRRSGRRGR
ncbi:MAG TPA: hypothetical protein VHY76_12375, partial [Acetobacteraceae bacterium]|nr:hypothetical protein [Acetobacteraceae bacterium]